MKRVILVFSLLFIASATFAQNQLTIHADQGKHKISKHIYGHFSEHLGRCIYGGFYAGENSKLPNTKGVRNDVIEALKKLKVPNLRWPGGCFADTYQWKDGIGPKSKRPVMVNKWWGNVTEDNSFGTHDFLDMCEKIGAEPYLSANVGSGVVQDVSDWIQYVNNDGVSPMSALRIENGREKPWKVTYWGVGNEAWGCGGNMTAEYYSNVYRQFATFMTNGNDKLFRIASGASDDDYHWTEVLMRDVPRHLIEGVALHHYSVIDWKAKSSATGFNESQYFSTLDKAILMDELVVKHSAIMDKYDPEKKIALIVDEWGGWYDVEPGTNPGFLYQQNTMRDAMIAGVTLNIFNNHSDRVRMANLAQTINVLQAVLLTNDEKILLTPTYHVMEMYNVHQDATMLPVELKTGEYSLGGKKLPAVSASASRDEKGLIHISLVNIDPKNPQEINLDLKGIKFATVTGRILTSSNLQNHNTFEVPDKVKPEVLKGLTASPDFKIKLPPFSVVVLELK